MSQLKEWAENKFKDIKTNNNTNQTLPEIKERRPSMQRTMQRRLEQPMEVFFSKNYSMPKEFNSSLTTMLQNDNSLLSYIHHQMELEPHYFNETAEAEKTAILRQRIANNDVPGFPAWNGFVQLKDETNKTTNASFETHKQVIDYVDKDFVPNQYFK